MIRHRLTWERAQLAGGSKPKGVWILVISVPAYLAASVRDVEWALPVAILTVIVGVLARLPATHLFVVCAAFDFPVAWPMVATINLSLFVIPLLVLELLAKARAKKHEIRRHGTKLLVWISLVVIAVLLSWLSNSSDTNSFLTSATKISLMFCALGVPLLSFSAGLSRVRWLDLMSTWLWVSLISATVGVVGYLAAAGLNIENQFLFSGYRATAGFGNPNSFAAFHVIALGIALAMLLNKAIKHSRLLLFSVCAQAVALVLSNSQTAHVSSLTMVAFALLLSFTSARTFFRTLITPLSGMSVGLLLEWFRLSSKESVSAVSLSQQVEIIPNKLADSIDQIESDQRWSIWEEALKLWTESPFFGIGLGAFQQESTQKLEAHSTQVKLLVEGGAVLWLLFAIPFILLAIQIWRHRSLRNFVPMLVGIAIFSVGQNLLFVTYVWFILGGLLGAVATGPSKNETTQRQIPSDP